MSINRLSRELKSMMLPWWIRSITEVIAPRKEMLQCLSVEQAH